MNTEKLAALEVELDRLQTAIHLVRMEQDGNAQYRDLLPPIQGLIFSPTHFGPSKLTGALRRTSLDVSRALSELRKPG